MRFHFILLAGGTGSRTGLTRPKQFSLLAGKPVLLYSLGSFLSWKKESPAVVVCHRDWQEEARRALDGEGYVHVPVIEGGSSRHSSTLAGLDHFKKNFTPNDLFLIHDAARPILEAAELDTLADYFSSPGSLDAASLAGRITDTIVEGSGLPGQSGSRLDREKLFAVKTPQAFRGAILERLLAVKESQEFTDLLSWTNAAGIQAELLPAGKRNYKYTNALDLKILEAML